MYQNAIFWIEVEKIKPNPFQPRKEFDEHKLRDLADSIKQYGILQPLVVTRREIEKPEGGLAVEYELIAGERRLRASKLAGLTQVPVLIRIGEEGREEEDRMKLELAIIENLQREDLNPVDRAKAFQRLVDDFGFKHVQIAQKVGKSREYVSNTLRLLGLPEEMLTALSERRINEGHSRPLLMLNDRKEEQMTLFKEIIFKKLNGNTGIK
jgi:ParB family chromosome partitioning protein